MMTTTFNPTSDFRGSMVAAVKVKDTKIPGGMIVWVNVDNGAVIVIIVLIKQAFVYSIGNQSAIGAHPCDTRIDDSA